MVFFSGEQTSQIEHYSQQTVLWGSPFMLPQRFEFSGIGVASLLRAYMESEKPVRVLHCSSAQNISCVCTPGMCTQSNPFLRAAAKAAALPAAR